MSTLRETEVRRSRPGNDRADPRPSVQSQVFSGATPQVPAATGGMNELSNAFGNFFSGLTNAAQIMQQAETQTRLEEVKQENERQQQQGAADALKGAEQNPLLTTDLDYTKAYAVTKGNLVGTQAATDFLAALSTQPRGTDPEAFRVQWVQKEFQGGTGDPTLDAHALATFKRTTDQAVLSMRIDNFKAQREEGLDALNQEIASRFAANQMTSSQDLTSAIQRATELTLGDPLKARAAVLGSLANLATTPGALQRVSTLLRDKGYGPNGESFEQMFPEAASQMQQLVVDKYMKALNADGFAAYNDIEERLRVAVAKNDVSAIPEIMRQLQKTRNDNGGERYYDALTNRATAFIAHAAKEITGFNNYVDSVKAGIVDQGGANKYQMQLLSNQGINPLAGAQGGAAAAAIVAQSRAISTDLKDTMATAMGAKDPQQMAAAYQFWKSLEGAGMDVGSWMNKYAKERYDSLNAILPYSGNNLDAAISAFNQNPEAMAKIGEDPKSMAWDVLMGKAGDQPAKIRAEVQQKLTSKLASTFDVTNVLGLASGSKLAIPTAVQDELMTSLGRRIQMLRAVGFAGDAPSRAMDDLLKNAPRDYWTIPGANGSMQLVRREDIPKIDQTGKPLLGPGLVRNPETGQDENTVANWKMDSRILNKHLPGVVDSPSDLYVSYDRVVTQKLGAFPIYDARTALPVRIAPGQRMDITEGSGLPARVFSAMSGLGLSEATTMKLPDDPVEAARRLQSALPPFITVIPQGTGKDTTFILGYNFHMTNGRTLDELEKDYDTSFARTMSPEARSALEARRAVTENMRRKP